MNKRFGAAAVVVAAVAAAAGSLASTSSGSAQTQPAIGMIVAGSGSPTAPEEVSGGQSAAAALGDTLAVSATDDPTGAIDSLIAEHVAAIAVQTGTEDPLIDRALGRARSAGIPTLALEGRSANAIWVSQSGSAQYAHALADALASQMHRRGQFITVPCDSGFRIVKTWTDDADAYIQHRYPRMHRVAIVVGGTGNGPAGTIVIRPLLKKYPHLRGFIFICPGESYEGPPQLVHAHKVGKVFTAGNGGDCPPLYIKLAKSVRAGSVEIVCAGDPTNLGYLAIWAADHLARNHTLTLTPGSYDVGGPVGTVQYYSQNQELRLGQPLTITKANLAQYAEPDLTLSPGKYTRPLMNDPAKQYSYDLGRTANATQSFTVTNGAPGTSGQLGMTGGDSHFVLENDTCTGATLTPNGTCTFTVAYTAPAGCGSGAVVGPAQVAVFGGDPSMPRHDIDLTVTGHCP